MNISYQLIPKIFFFTRNPKESPDVEGSMAMVAKTEAEQGGKLFGELMPGQKREFYQLSEQVWVWHEQWQVINGSTKSRTTFYEVKNSGIYKSQEGLGTNRIQGREADNLTTAIRLYKAKITSQQK